MTVALGADRRRDAVAALSEDRFDVLVVGGGIVGAGAALDAATRGLRVGVVEAQDWASGTSSRSSKLIHGGLRYLAMHDFGLVREALAERATLQLTAPHLVRRLPILYPLRRGPLERLYVGSGVLLYDLFARSGPRAGRYPFHRQLSKRRALEMAPALDSSSLTGAVQYYDGQVDDARHTLSVLRTAVDRGAVALSRARVVGLLGDDSRVEGAVVRDEESGEQLEVRARAVASATGAWTGRFEHLAGRPEGEIQVQPSKGVHLVVPRANIDASTAMIVPTDKSVLFVLPWGQHWLIGTTDTQWNFDVSRPAASSADVDYLLATVNRVLTRPLARSDVESVYVGIRPLVGSGGETAKLSREHVVRRLRSGLVLISGGKYTTYRVMAKDLVDAVIADAALGSGPCVTATVKLVGAEFLDEARRTIPGLLAELAVSPAHTERLIGRYGGLVGEVLEPARRSMQLREEIDATGYLLAEIAYAVSHEDARHLDDVLRRRTRIAMETADRGVSVAPLVAEIMAGLLGWDDDRRRAEVADYEALVAVELACEAAPDDAAAAAVLEALDPLLPLP